MLATEATPGPASTPTAPPEASGDEVPESRAIMKNGQITLEGAVPDQASADAIVALAAQYSAPKT